MPRSDVRTLLDRGRRAGLRTSDLYSALSGRQPMSGDVRADGLDSNGFSAHLDEAGRTLYKPDSKGSES